MKIFLFNELHGLALGGKMYMGAEVLRCQINLFYFFIFLFFFRGKFHTPILSSHIGAGGATIAFYSMWKIYVSCNGLID